MENIYANLFAPEARVCGVWLRRYTLWHHALLSAFRSPILSRDPSATINGADLLWNVELCRTPYPRLPRTRLPVHRWHWGAILWSPDALRREAGTLAAWIGAHCAGPLFWRDSSRKHSAGLTAPDVYSLVYGLTSKAGLTQQEAWSTSPGQAETILGTVAELDGAELHFADPAELAPERAPIQPTTREEVLARATADLGPARAAKFMEAWDRSHSN